MNALIVEDEFYARELLADYVAKIPFLHLVKTCENVFQAMEVMQKQDIDILILDIQMPDMTGLDFVRSLNRSPIIIFCTAYSEYAIEGFELDVADYLLKPIEFPRFLQAIYKAKSRHEAKVLAEDQNPAHSAVGKMAEKEDDFLIVKDGAKIYKIDYADILFIEGQREYVTFHTTKKNITGLYVIRTLEESLPADRFLRVHKSYIVALKYIEMIEGNMLKIGNVRVPIGGVTRGCC